MTKIIRGLLIFSTEGIMWYFNYAIDSTEKSVENPYISSSLNLIIALNVPTIDKKEMHYWYIDQMLEISIHREMKQWMAIIYQSIS